MGAWLKVEAIVARHRDLLEQMILEPPKELKEWIANSFLLAPFPW